MSIYKEGYGTIAIVAIALIVINFLYVFFLGEYKWPGYLLQAGSIFLMILVLQFFRNPDRHIVENKYVVLSAADGEVVAIEEVDEPEYLKCRCIQISVFMSVWNVHSNRWPIAGEVTYFQHHQGKYLVASHPKSSTENERTSIAVKHENGTEIFFRQIAGYVARRIVAPIKVGATARQGIKFGFIKFGSRVDHFIPLDSIVRVKVGEKVSAGLSILADLPKVAAQNTVSEEHNA